MKKILSLIIAVVMISSVIVPAGSAFAAARNTEIPIIYIRGNGQAICNADGEEVICDIGDLSLEDDEDEGKNKIVEATVNILLPFLTEGLIFDNWDGYEKAIYDEISPLFKEAILDGNGDPQYGTHLDPELQEINERSKIKYGNYSFYTYGFYFDWRLSHYDNLEKLEAYIDNVLEATGAEQIALTSRCLGGSLLNVYLEKHADDKSPKNPEKNLIKNVMYCDTLSSGCTLISKGFSGQLEFDSKSIQMYEAQLGYLDEIGYGTGMNIPGIAGEIVEKTLDLFTQTGVVDKLTDSVEKLYSRLYKALIPALFKAIGYASQPIYWTFVEEEDFDLALKVMFGEEGSEERIANEGLIDKILKYRENITSKHDELLKSFADEIHIGVVAKYGLMAAPITTGYGELSDTLASVKDSSMGATCSTIGKTLTDDYIQGRINKGYADYISPDKQVDTSTCLFPETTWIIKNAHHDDFDRCFKDLAETFLSGTNVTVKSSGYSRFRVVDYKNNAVTDMTEENCADLEFLTVAEENPTTETKLASLIRFLTVIIDFFTRLFKGELDFSKLFG